MKVTKLCKVIFSEIYTSEGVFYNYRPPLSRKFINFAFVDRV